MPTYIFFCKTCNSRLDIFMSFADFRYPVCINCLSPMNQEYSVPNISPFIASKDPWNGYSTALGVNTTGRSDFMQKCKSQGLEYVGSDFESSVNKRRKEIKEAAMDGEAIS